MSMIGTGGSHEKSTVQVDNYWKDKVDILIEEKKKWLEMKKEMRSKILKLTD